MRENQYLPFAHRDKNKSDYYQTPYSMTNQLLENEPFVILKTIADPASGEGAITTVLNKQFKNVFSGDLHFTGFDFLKQKMDNVDYIITNPPFSKADEFIMRCKEIAKDKFALLLPLNYLHGQARYNKKIFSGLHTVYVFTRYPMLTDQIRADGKYKTGMMVYAWYVWYNYEMYDSKRDPVIKWIDNDKYVLRLGK